MQQRTEGRRSLREIKSSKVISRKYTDREGWFKWVVSHQGDKHLAMPVRDCLDWVKRSGKYLK